MTAPAQTKATLADAEETIEIAKAHLAWAEFAAAQSRAALKELEESENGREW